MLFYRQWDEFWGKWVEMLVSTTEAAGGWVCENAQHLPLGTIIKPGDDYIIK